MGNAKSQPSRPRRPLYLFYLIHRTWSIVVEHRSAGKEERYEDTDRETDLNSRCSGCAGCCYRQESFSFDSESEMAPNAEEELLAVKPWAPHPDKQQERLRPPTYNAEDYAVALRRWGRRPIPSPAPETQNGTLPSTTSSSSGYASGCGEMTLRQFTSVSELLNKLRTDLRLAFPSFVQEFASAPADGITLLLETLRGVQLAQNSPPSGQTGPRIGTRRAALDELGCVECLAACGERCADAPRLLIEAQPGLLALAVCLTSSLNRSRVLALQLLTRVCQAPGGHAAVSEAVSTLRLRYGEGGRFRFLAGALLAPSAAIVLRVAGISFLNAFIKSAPRAQTKLYIQAEACEAGLEPKVLQEWLTDLDSSVEESMTELLRKEVHRWSRNCVDVEALQKRASRAEETCRMLGKKILSLQRQIETLQVVNMNGYNASKLASKPGENNASLNAEDEGISSSERSSTPEELLKREDLDGGPKASGLPDNDQETTIDDVIEELRIIVKDAEEEYEDKTGGVKHGQRRPPESCSSVSSRPNNPGGPKTQRSEPNPVTYFGGRRPADSEDLSCSGSTATRKLSSGRSTVSKSSAGGSLKILVKGPDIEEAIVPAIIHPQPPKRSAPCISAILAGRGCGFAGNEEPYVSPGEEIEEETLGDGSDSLLSASRLKYPAEEPAPPFPVDKTVSNKTIRNYDGGMARRAGFVSHRAHSQGSAQEGRRKTLRRTSSQDCLDARGRGQRVKRSESGVEGRIRKFESLNSVDNLSADSGTGMRRSESFHQVSLGAKESPASSSRGGSDAGLFYVTNFDLEPVVTQMARRGESQACPKNSSLLTKSLDRIDEGLDSMVDIVLTEDKEWGENGARLRPDKRAKSATRDNRQQIRNDEFYASFCKLGSKHLRSDELYTDKSTPAGNNLQWSYQTELNNPRKSGSQTCDRAVLSASGSSRPDSFSVDKSVGSKFSKGSNESGIYLPGRSYDAFGLSKNRFNAGKYSGNNLHQAKLTPARDGVNPCRNSIVLQTNAGNNKHGKVTDVISGLY
ncbi:uncharacterized protein mwh isoform X1 [Neodiprion pinetum]|uniref:uncharacterized protein mwh isoform X1 n=2 Tax=Neodiprion pinetum TaxID=441929 RepID=UPI001EDEB7F7|nr:uncharacterized protein LOC124211055 isoform X1 [Neodiprion pinetum]